MTDLERALEPFAPDPRLAEAERLSSEGTRLVMSGSAIGVASVASAVLLGATCPLCVVGVPALIGYGIYQRLRGETLKRGADAGPQANEAPLSRSPEGGEDPA